VITIEEFQRIELRVATILSAERVPGTEKLLKLQIDLGSEHRQLVAGIAKHYTPEETDRKADRRRDELAARGHPRDRIAGDVAGRQHG
jgi:hypothetical protein